MQNGKVESSTAVIRLENILYFYYCQKKNKKTEGKNVSLYFPTFLHSLRHDAPSLFPPTENVNHWKLNFKYMDGSSGFGVQLKGAGEQLRYLIAVRIQRQVQLWDSSISHVTQCSSMVSYIHQLHPIDPPVLPCATQCLNSFLFKCSISPLLVRTLSNTAGLGSVEVEM